MRPYEPQFVGSRIASGNYSPAVSGSSSLNHDDRLLLQFVRSCHSVISQAERAVELALAVRDELTEQINRVRDDAGRIPPGR